MYIFIFRPIAFVATMSTAIAVILITIAALIDLPNNPNPSRESPTVLSFALAFGTMLYAYSGAGTFPTIQYDMREPQKFPKSVQFAFIGDNIYTSSTL